MQLEKVADAVVLRMQAGKANAIGPAWLARMETLLDEALAARPRALVITGYEGFFSAGLDLPALDALAEEQMGSFVLAFSRTMLRVFELPLPVVAAVNGHAIAGGCVLALQADLRVGARAEFRMGLNEVQLGIALPAVVLETLRAQVPPQSLLPIALEGRLFTPQEANALGLLHELVPAANPIGVLTNPNFADAHTQLRDVESAAESLGSELLVLKASTETELDAAFTALVQRGAGALLVPNDPFFTARRGQLHALAAGHGIPAMYTDRDDVVGGGLMSYGASRPDSYRQVGVYVGRILKGEKPAELPVMQPTRFEFVINLKTAKALGLDVPPSLLVRADEVIE